MSLLEKIKSVIPFDTPGRKEVGIVAIFLWFHGIKRAMDRSDVKIPVPPVLMSILGALGGLGLTHAMEGQEGVDSLINYFTPSVDFLGNYMALWLVPPLVLVPKAASSLKESSPSMWAKTIVIHYALFLSTIIGAGALYKAIKPSGETGSTAIPTAAPAATLNAAATAAAAAVKRKKQLVVLKFWGVVAIGFHASDGGDAAKTVALTSTAIAAISAGNMMDPSVKKVLHPLLFSAIVSGVVTIVKDQLGANPSADPIEALVNEFSYKAGIWKDSKSGDLLYMFLGPACAALAFRIYSQARKMQNKLPAIIGASAVAAGASIFISPLIGKCLGLPSEINGALAHRSVTSPLAIAGAEAMNISPQLTAVAVVVTGLYGCCSQWVNEAMEFEEDDEVGVSVGTSSHSIGTAALVADRPSASASSSVAMISAGIAHSIISAIPGVSEIVHSIM